MKRDFKLSLLSVSIMFGSKEKPTLFTRGFSFYVPNLTTKLELDDNA
jgi:hypothetical protein